ncbi:MAG: RadC family protein [Bacteroidota bacterium]
MRIKDLPLDDRPREKMFLRGLQSLSDAELLAILLRTGYKGNTVIDLSRSLLLKYGNLSRMASLSAEALVKDKGIKRDKAAALMAAFEISRRIASQNKTIFDTRITSPNDLAGIFIPMLRDEVKEVFMVVCLNSANKIVKYDRVSVGSLNCSIVHAREIFKVAIENNSANIILVHNHPSGNTEPSNEDIAVTRKLVEAGKILDIQVFDHLIVAGNSYLSFVEKRLL